MVDNCTFGAGNLQACLLLVGHSLWLLGHMLEWLCRMPVFADCVKVFLNLVSLAVGKEAVD